VTLVTDDFDDWYERLKLKRVVFEAPPSQYDALKICHCLLKDLDGYQTETLRLGEPAWPEPD